MRQCSLKNASTAIECLSVLSFFVSSDESECTTRISLMAINDVFLSFMGESQWITVGHCVCHFEDACTAASFFSPDLPRATVTKFVGRLRGEFCERTQMDEMEPSSSYDNQQRYQP